MLHKLSKERTKSNRRPSFLRPIEDNAKQLEEAIGFSPIPSAGVELHKMATEESADVRTSSGREIEEQAKEFFIPKDPRDEKSLVLEIRAGTGGDEAALVCGGIVPHVRQVRRNERIQGRYGRSHRNGHRGLQGRRCA